MTNSINFNAQSLIQSQSPKAPFIAIFEQDDQGMFFYAIEIKGMDPEVIDQLQLNLDDTQDIVIHWNSTGERAALIVQERIIAILDFKLSVIFHDSVVPDHESTWLRQKLEFTAELAIEFGIDQFFKQPFLDDVIDAVASDETQINRLLLYKDLLKSKLFVPITTKSPDDPNTLIYTFQNQETEKVDIKGNLICAFTNFKLYEEQIGQYGLSYQKISADYLCFGAQSFPDILGITLTSNSGKSVLISREEFKLLSLISQPQRMDTNTLLKELGDVFFEDLYDENRDQLVSFVTNNVSSLPIYRASYYCQPKVDGAKPVFCVVLNSSNASDSLTQLVSDITSSGLQSFCECHVFSLSDILAQALEQSKTSIFSR